MSHKHNEVTAELKRLAIEADSLLEQMAALAQHVGFDDGKVAFGPYFPAFDKLIAALKANHEKQFGLRLELRGKSVEEYQAWLGEPDGHFDLDPVHRQVEYVNNLCLVYSAFDRRSKEPVLVVGYGDGLTILTRAQALLALIHNDWSFAERPLTQGEEKELRLAIAKWLEDIM